MGPLDTMLKVGVFLLRDPLSSTHPRLLQESDLAEPQVWSFIPSPPPARPQQMSMAASPSSPPAFASTWRSLLPLQSK